MNTMRLTTMTRWAAVLAGMALTAVDTRAQDLPAQPRDYVVDLAGVVERGTLQRLNGYLQELEQKTGTQLIVLTVNSTGGVPVRDYALRVGEKWKLGRKGKDNGLLAVIAVKDRQWTFEVGYGLEAVLPDAFCGRVGRDVFVPHFKQGQYGPGILEGTLVLANQVATKAGVQIGGMPARSLSVARRGAARGGKAQSSGVVCVVVAVFLLVFIVVASRRRRGSYGYTGSIWPWLLLDVLTSGSRGRHTWGGGGWGGGFGGGGSFGGGGGGSFGGGGASGGW